MQGDHPASDSIVSSFVLGSNSTKTIDMNLVKDFNKTVDKPMFGTITQYSI